MENAREARYCIWDGWGRRSEELTSEKGEEVSDVHVCVRNIPGRRKEHANTCRKEAFNKFEKHHLHSSSSALFPVWSPSKHECSWKGRGPVGPKEERGLAYLSPGPHSPCRPEQDQLGRWEPVEPTLTQSTRKSEWGEEMLAMWGELELLRFYTLESWLIYWSGPASHVWPHLRDLWLSPHLPVIAVTGWHIHEDFGILEMGSLMCDWPLLCCNCEAGWPAGTASQSGWRTLFPKPMAWGACHNQRAVLEE